MNVANTGKHERALENKMSDIFKVIQENFKFYKTSGASDELIKEAERQLNCRFADDYKKYLSTFGAISFGSTELTGLNIDSYANVVSVTLKEMQRHKNFPRDSIVLENTGMEGLLILQNEDGEVYEWVDGEKKEVFSDLNDFLESKLI